MKTSELKQLIKEEILKSLNEVTIINPIATPERIWAYSKNVPEDKMDTWFTLLGKYGLAEFEDGLGYEDDYGDEDRKEPGDILYFLQSLSQDDLYQFYNEMKLIFPIK